MARSAEATSAPAKPLRDPPLEHEGAAKFVRCRGERQKKVETVPMPDGEKLLGAILDLPDRASVMVRAEGRLGQHEIRGRRWSNVGDLIEIRRALDKRNRSGRGPPPCQQPVRQWPWEI